MLEPATTHLHLRHKPPRIARFVKMIDAFERDELETAVDMLIAALDAADGDTDLELNGDEQDATGAAEEDTFLFAFGAGDGFAGDPDDAEDGDEDRCSARDDEPRGGMEPCANRGTDAGDIGSEEDQEPEDRAETMLTRRHRDRIRQTRCDHRPRSRLEWPLRDQAVSHGQPL